MIFQLIGVMIFSFSIGVYVGYRGNKIYAVLEGKKSIKDWRVVDLFRFVLLFCSATFTALMIGVVLVDMSGS